MNVDKVRRRPPREVGGGLQRVVDDWGGRDDKTSKAVEVKSHVTSRGGEAASKSSVNASDGAPWRRYSLPRQPYPDLREGALLPLVLCCHIPGFTECDLHAWQGDCLPLSQAGAIIDVAVDDRRTTHEHVSDDSFLVSRDGGTCNRRQSLSVAVAEDKREVTDATSFCFSGERGSALSPPRTIQFVLGQKSAASEGRQVRQRFQARMGLEMSGKQH
ncbi:hypothetical protein C0Q70_02630 [Pomacea canaliculata]|uniref:Uncharacterized protein n=1 Tax=Pomacea canaliculata TaxID=400727 RepID=A0A2T7PQL5_POMCA|nr:hypothetical protein C0Q70_02630 [Pomacea canaliculata]